MDSPKGKGKAVQEPAVDDSGSDDSDEERDGSDEDAGFGLFDACLQVFVYNSSHCVRL